MKSSIEGFPWWLRGKEIDCNAGDSGSIPGSGRSSGGAMATYSSILAWRIPWAEEPGGLQSTGSQKVRHDWAPNTFSSLFTWPCSFTENQLGTRPWAQRKEPKQPCSSVGAGDELHSWHLNGSRRCARRGAPGKVELRAVNRGSQWVHFFPLQACPPSPHHFSANWQCTSLGKLRV